MSDYDRFMTEWSTAVLIFISFPLMFIIGFWWWFFLSIGFFGLVSESMKRKNKPKQSQ